MNDIDQYRLHQLISMYHAFSVLGEDGVLEELRKYDPETLFQFLQNLMIETPSLTMVIVRICLALDPTKGTQIARNMLQNPKPYFREHGAGILSDVEPTQDVIKDLVSALKDSDADVRSNAIFSLGKIGNLSTIPHLEKVFLTDKGINRHGHRLAQIAKKSIELLENNQEDHEG